MQIKRRKKPDLGPDDSTASDTGSEYEEYETESDGNTAAGKKQKYGNITSDEVSKPELRHNHKHAEEVAETDDAYLIYRIKRSVLGEIIKKTTKNNPVMEKALTQYFSEINSHTFMETSRGRLLHSNEELISIKEKLKAMLDEVRGLLYGKSD